VQRIVAPIFARNAASQRVAVKAGFVLEALQPRSLIKGGAVIDVALFAIYRPAAIPA
jgi:RimJ/RimL family protein N-acetyltransferase